MLTVAPVILPPECNTAEKIYSTLPIAGLPIDDDGILGTNTGDRWTHDQLKFTETQFRSSGNLPIAVTLGHKGAGNLAMVLSAKGIPNTPWSVGGDGGAMMATPPLNKAPYGKILLGKKHLASKGQWKGQNIQPVALIDTTWLLVGHVDEALMWVSPTKVLYADPWKAADLLHQEIVAGRDTGMM